MPATDAITGQAPLLARAISFSAARHHGQMRKCGATPYFAHPVRVMTILAQELEIQDPEILATAVLHDTLEDTDTDRDDLAAAFGERVAHWVALLTKDKRLPAEEREATYRATLANAPSEVHLCKLADALDNLRDSHSLAGQRPKTIRKTEALLDALRPNLQGDALRALALVDANLRHG